MTKQYLAIQLYKNKLYVKEKENGIIKTKAFRDYDKGFKYYRPDVTGKHNSFDTRKYKEYSINSIYKYNKKIKALVKEGQEVWGADNIIHQYIMNEYPADASNYSLRDFRVVRYDIETEYAGIHKDPEEGFYAINLITLHNTQTNTYYICHFFPNKPRIEEIKKEIAVLNINFDDYKVIIKDFNDEFDMLHWTLSFIGKNADILGGLNNIMFDDPSLYYRAKKIGVDVSIMSPFGVINETTTRNAYGKIQATIEIMGINVYDIMLLAKFLMKSLPSYSLQYLSEMVLKSSKLEYTGSLYVLAQENLKKFFAYGFMDIFNTVGIDEREGLSDSALALAYLKNVDLSDYDSVVTGFENIIAKYLKEDFQQISGMTPLEVHKRFPYLGGYNFLIKAGLYLWLVIIDMKAMYPSVDETFNISFENIFTLETVHDDIKAVLKTEKYKKLFNVLNENGRNDVPIKEYRHSRGRKISPTLYKLYKWSSAKGKFIEEPIEVGQRIPAMKQDGTCYYPYIEDLAVSDKVDFIYPLEDLSLLNITPEHPLYRDVVFATGDILSRMPDISELQDLLRFHNLSMVPSLVFFSREKEGILPHVFVKLKSKRKHWQGLHKGVLSELQVVMDAGIEESIDELTHEATKTKRQDKSYKKVGNSGYGACANIHFKYFNINVATGITSGSQYFIKSLRYHLNLRLNEVFGTSGVSYIRYGDTDSLDIHIERFVSMVTFKDKPNPEKVDYVKPILNFYDKWLDPNIKEILETSCKYLNAYTNAMIMELEKINSEMLFSAKKKYDMRSVYVDRVIYKDGKISSIGTASKSISYPKKIVKWLDEALVIILDKDAQGLYTFIEEKRKEFKQVTDIKTISTKVKISDYQKYVEFIEGDIYDLYPANEIAKAIKTRRYFEGSDYYLKSGARPIAKGVSFANYLIRKRNLEIETLTTGTYGNLIPLINAPSQFLFFTEDIEAFGVKTWQIDFDTQFENMFLKPLYIKINASGVTPQRPGLISLF